MKRITTLAVLVGVLAVAMAACSSDNGDSGPEPVSTATAVPTATSVPIIRPETRDAVPEDAEVGRKAATLIGIDLHRQLWATRPSNNYAFGFQWNVGEYAYQRANVQVRVIQSEIDDVLWAETAVKTDGTEPVGLVVPDEPDIDDYYSVDGLFELLLEAIESDPVRISLGFDSVFGFPTLAVIEFAPGNDHDDVSFFAFQLVPIAGPAEFGDATR